MLSLKRSVHGMRCIEAVNLTREQCQTVRRVVTNRDSLSEDYRLCTPVGAFLQGYDDSRGDKGEGWVLVEFWQGDADAIQAFIDHINRQVFSSTKESVDAAVEAANKLSHSALLEAAEEGKKLDE